MNKRVVAAILGVSFLAIGLQAIAKDPPPEEQLESKWSDPKTVALIKAIDGEDLDEIDRLVKEGADVNALDIENLGTVKRVDKCPLAYAVDKRKKAAYERLLEHGAETNLPFQHYRSLLHYIAHHYDDSQWLELALKHGADPNLGTFETPIFAAIASARPQSVQLLIKAGADLNHRDGSGETPLLSAATDKKYEMVYGLLEAGADYLARCDYGYHLPYRIIDRSVDPENERAPWREKVIEWLIDRGVVFDDAEVAIARLGKDYLTLPPIKEWQLQQTARANRWATIEAKDARDFRLRGAAWLLKQEYDKAIDDFGQAILRDPQNATNYLLRGRAWTAKGRAARQPADEYLQAIVDLTNAVKWHPRRGDTLAARAEAWRLKGQPADAITDLSKALRLDPGNSAWRWQRALARIELAAVTNDSEQYDRAIADCEEAIVFAGNLRDPRAYRALGLAHLGKRDYRKAIDGFDKALRLYEEALVALPDFAETYGDRAKAWSGLGDAERAAADLAAAKSKQRQAGDDADDFDKAVAELTDAITQEPSEVANYLELARLYATPLDERPRDLPKAVEWATKACEVSDWKSAAALAALAAMNEASGKLDDAIKWQAKAVEAAGPDDDHEAYRQTHARLVHDQEVAEATAAIERDPQLASNYRRRAEARIRYAQQTSRQDEYAKGIADCDQAILLDPKDARAFYDRAIARPTDFVQALDDYTKALELDPKFAAGYAARGATWYENGQLVGVFNGKAQAAKNYARAIQDLTEAIRLRPEDERSYWYRANTWREQGDFAKAIEDYTAAIRLRPGKIDYYLARAGAFSDSGDLDEAIRAYTEVVHRDPDNREAYDHRGEAWLAKKDYDRAIADFTVSGAFQKRRLIWKSRGEYQKYIDDLRALVREEPDDFSRNGDLAHILAACPDAAFRDGPKAVEYALKACELTDWRNPEMYATLAAAYAEVGKFEEAVKLQTKAIAVNGNRADWPQRLALYQRGQPYREPMPEPPMPEPPMPEPPMPEP